MKPSNVSIDFEVCQFYCDSLVLVKFHSSHWDLGFDYVRYVNRATQQTTLEKRLLNNDTHLMNFTESLNNSQQYFTKVDIFDSTEQRTIFCTLLDKDRNVLLYWKKIDIFYFSGQRSKPAKRNLWLNSTAPESILLKYKVNSKLLI